MRLRVGAGTDIGRVRAINEDVYLSRAEQGLFVVCDGMGGSEGGEVASQMAVDAILEQLASDSLGAFAPAPTDGQRYLPHTSRLAAAVRRSNQVIYRQAQQDARHAEMGTTIVGALIEDHIASVAHVGDSRAYLWHDDALEPLTRDHSLVEAQVRAGLLDREASLRSAQQNILLRVMGREPEIDVDLIEVPVQPGDYLLLCSDGLTRMVSDHTLAAAICDLRDPQRICDHLIEAANRNGGADNITVVVVEVPAPWWKRTVNRLRKDARKEHDGQAHCAM
jgi:protein phosphatase